MTISATEHLRLVGIALGSIGGVMIVDARGRLVFFNEEVRRLTLQDPSPELTLDQRIREFGLRYPDGRSISPDEMPLRRSLRGETVVDALLLLAKPGGGELFVSCAASPALDEQGNLIGAICIFSDATERVLAERKQAEVSELLWSANERLTISALAAKEAAEREQALREDVEAQKDERERLLGEVQRLAEISVRRAAELDAIISNMFDGVFVYDTGGLLTLANEAGKRLMGAAGPEEISQGLRGFPAGRGARHLDGKPILPEEVPLARALKGELVEKDDEIIANLLTRRDIFVRVSAAPIRGENGKVAGAVVVVRDLTELMELDRLKDQFITTAAHELKTPVTAIKGYAQLLLRRDNEGVSPQAMKALQAINRQSDRISGLVNDLLDISRLMSGRLELLLERVNLPELVTEVADRMALTTTMHDIRIAKAEPVVVQGDKERLGEVLTNLIDNAIKFSPRGGPSHGRIDLSVSIAGGEAVVSVKDSGVGIPKEKQPRIFQSFYRAHAGTPDDFGGIGVGLFISKEIITRHGGRIWFESEEGKGSTFSFSLPITGARGKGKRGKS